MKYLEEQLLLFEEDKEEKMEREVQLLRAQCEKVRKGQFAKIAELKKLYLETRYELETLKNSICRIPSQFPNQTKMF